MTGVQTCALPISLKTLTLLQDALEFGICSWQEGDTDIHWSFPYPSGSDTINNAIFIACSTKPPLASPKPYRATLAHSGAMQLLCSCTTGIPTNHSNLHTGQKSNKVIQRILLQPVDRAQLPHLWNRPSSITGTPQTSITTKDHRGIQQHFFHSK